MQYTHTNDNDRVVLRHQRLRALEQDHYTAELMLEELPDDKHAREDLAELERRIAHHRSVFLSMMESVGKPESDDKDEA